MTPRAELPIPDRRELEARYQKETLHCERILELFRQQVVQLFKGTSLRPTVKARVKTFESYYHKLQSRSLAGGPQSPEAAIQDVLGLRIVCPFLEDLAVAEAILQKNLEVLEKESKGDERTFREFGYQSTHLLVRIPSSIPVEGRPVCEIQIRTILQDAWAEVEHELVYKADFAPFDEPLRRKLASLNATLTLSDIIFQEIRDYQSHLLTQLSRRREIFRRKLRQSLQADGPADEDPTRLADSGEEENAGGAYIRLLKDDRIRNDIDQLLLEALNAHNAHHFAEAIRIYTAILSLEPPPPVRSMIHIHRGMAYFTESEYQKALLDFDLALASDAGNCKALYFRGTVYSVLQDYPQAIRDFSESLRMNPFQLDPLLSRARIYCRTNRYSEALSDCERALQMDPESAEAQQISEQIASRSG